jgi:ribose transport system permease protein
MLEMTNDAALADRTRARERRRDLIQKFAALGSLVALVVAFSATSNAFMSLGNAMTVALQVTSIAYLGIGATCVIITGGIDLSVGSVLALSGVAAAMLVKAGVPVPIGMLGGVVVGSICGALNGVFVTRMGLPPFIAARGRCPGSVIHLRRSATARSFASSISGRTVSPMSSFPVFRTP